MKNYLLYKRRWIFYVVFTLIYLGMSSLLYYIIPKATGALITTMVSLGGALIISMVALGALVLFIYTLFFRRLDLWPILYTLALLLLVSIPGLIYSFGVSTEQSYGLPYILMGFHACLQSLVIIVAYFFVKVGKNIEKAR